MHALGESLVYEFAGFRLDARNHRLYRQDSGQLVHLTPKAAELLILFVQNRGRLITKEEILDTVWTGLIVEESNLSQTIFLLRKALGDDSKEPHFVLTIPNRGYQFISSVLERNTQSPTFNGEVHPASPVLAPQIPPQGQGVLSRKSLTAALALALLAAFAVAWFYLNPRAPSLSQIRTIAVLPFEDTNAPPTEEYLGTALADAMVTKFSSLKQITVRPIRTVSKYAGSRDQPDKIGRELRVDAVLDGQIQRSADRLRVNVQLIRSTDGKAVWRDSFEDSFANLFAVENSINQETARAISLPMDQRDSALLQRPATAVPEAYQEYLKGRFFWNKRTAENFQRAVEHFKQAIKLDPDFALAHSGLAQTYVLLNLFGTKHDPNAFPMGRLAAERALELDPNLADAHAALAQVKLQYDFDWPGVETSYLEAIRLEENDAVVRQWYGEFLALMGRIDESIAQLEKAKQLDPTSLSTNTALALPYLRAGQPDKALEIIDEVLLMDPHFAWALHYRGRAQLQKRDHKGAVETYRVAYAASNESLVMKVNLAVALARAGQTAEAVAIHAELKEAAGRLYVSPYNFALINNALGNQAEAIRYLHMAVDERDFLTISMKGDTFLANLRSEPAFAEVLRKANL
jgi:DNA-binding winged helix-turn-helix (wHTH) protein/TolB-like protein/Tfp pilus assembly protein PilF